MTEDATTGLVSALSLLGMFLWAGMRMIAEDESDDFGWFGKFCRLLFRVKDQAATLDSTTIQVDLKGRPARKSYRKSQRFPKREQRLQSRRLQVKYQRVKVSMPMHLVDRFGDELDECLIDGIREEKNPEAWLNRNIREADRASLLSFLRAFVTLAWLKRA